MESSCHSRARLYETREAYEAAVLNRCLGHNFSRDFSRGKLDSFIVEARGSQFQLYLEEAY